MRYIKSELDNKNFGWFQNDMTRNSLHGLKIVEGHLRGLEGISIDFKYPITAIAGKNGSGKSTILAIVACGFHNELDGFNPNKRGTAYYTFSEFFIQSSDDVPPEGIELNYQIASSDWSSSEQYKTGIRTDWFSTKKRKGGRWKNYEKRLNRDVIFFGIDRVVPHNEKSVSKSYRKNFVDIAEKGTEKKVSEIVGRILDRRYESFKLKEHSGYSLPVVKTGKTTYSGFNMGAGENALFEIFSIILSGPEGLLIVIDEIELGLHEQAQKRMMNELKTICEDRKIQIICTTHSAKVLESLPPEARIFIEKSISGKTNIIQEIVPSFAVGKLSGDHSSELSIFVEDIVAKEIVDTLIGTELRGRVNVIEIGSDAAISRQMASMYKSRKEPPVCALYDGDKRSSQHLLKKNFEKAFETPSKEKKESVWFVENLSFLPGDIAPEKWLIKSLSKIDLNILSNEFEFPIDDLQEIVRVAIDGPVHKEFRLIAEKLNTNESTVRQSIIKKVVLTKSEDLIALKDFIKKKLMS